MSADLGCLIPPLQPFAKALVNLAGRAGVQPRVTSTCRSRSEQQRLYSAFLRGETKYPVAPPGQSAHEAGFAFDMVASTTEDLHDLGTVWQQWGGVWHPSDEVHFEYPGFVPVAVPEDFPVQPAPNVIAKIAQAYADLPWYATLFLPTAATVAKGSFQEGTQGSLGARALCWAGFSAFC